MKIPERMPELMGTPAVFAVRDNYQIMVMARTELLFWVTVDGEDYYDHSNGIIRSSAKMHRVNVPMEALNKAGEYTVSYRRIIDRKPYFPTTEDTVSQTFEFRGIRKSGPIRMYHLSDTHGRFTHAANAASYFGDDLDVLILNGDVIDHSGNIKNFDLIYKLCEAVTGGARPVICTRGNHDTRGFYAENIADYTPTDNGRSYYPVNFGRVWCMVLDSGEDKPDTHAEYGGTIACHQFRLEEKRDIEKIVKNADEEYNADGVEFRLAIMHSAFADAIEFELYPEMLGILRNDIKTQLMIAGHNHDTAIYRDGEMPYRNGQACPVVFGSRLVYTDGKRTDFVGTAFTFENGEVKIEFTDSQKNVVGGEIIKLIK